MPYCKHCGAEMPEGATYCQRCGTRAGSVARYTLANWGERFVAWIIDMIVIGIFLAPIKFFIGVAWPGITWTPNIFRLIPFVDFGLDNIIYFFYWTIMEGTNGQSIGKMAMKIKVTMLNGEPIDMAHAAVESLGKAFLLPIDCIIGWFLYQTRNQRLFNYISETIIVKPSRSRPK